MKSFYTLTVGGEEYKLRLTTNAILSIEKKLGTSLYKALENMQDNLIESLITILWGAMQPLNANFPFEKAATMLDSYIDDGNSIEDFMEEINGLFRASGFFKKGQAS